MAYRASPRVSVFLDRVLAIQQEVSSDQLAFNLALFDDGRTGPSRPYQWVNPPARFRSTNNKPTPVPLDLQQSSAYPLASSGQPNRSRR